MTVRLSGSSAFLYACFLLASLVLLPLATAQLTPVQRGEQLFVKQWEQIQPADEHGADGLGPMFNAKSCLACHNQGGVGGAGDNSTNVQLISVLPRQKSDGTFRSDEQAVKLMFEHADGLHPELATSNMTMLHRSSIHETEYANWQSENLGFKSLKNLSDQDKRLAERLLAKRDSLLHDVPIYRTRKLNARQRFTLQISRRNTPTLFGVSEVESILDDDIRAIAIKQAEQDGPVKGIVAELPKGKVGKFGWRGEHSSVADFTAQACAIELGLSNSRHDQPKIPFEPRPPMTLKSFQFLTKLFPLANVCFLETDEPKQDSPAHGPEEEFTAPAKLPDARKHDMTEQELDDMVQFVNSLPSLQPLSSLTDDGIKTVADGRSHFEAIGCADCHVRKVGTAVNVFSDFLLHDMGAELADAAGAIRFRPGASVAKVSNDRLWQTPPLWGLALSAPYLHDGRAKDLPTAIAMHGGEASDSVEKFNELSKENRKSLMKFLGSLSDSNLRSGISSGGVASGGWSSNPRPQRGQLVGRRTR